MWYLQRNNTVIGPVSEKVVVENWYNGKIEQSDLISFDKLNWNRFDKCVSFSHLFPKVPNLQKYQGVSNEITSRSVKNTFGNFISEGLYAGKQYQLGIDFWRNHVYQTKYKGKKYFDDAFNTHPKQSVGFFAKFVKYGSIFNKKVGIEASNGFTYCSCQTCQILTDEAHTQLEFWKNKYFILLNVLGGVFVLVVLFLSVLSRLIQGQ